MAENKLKFSDIIELAKAGYTPEQVKELIQLSKDTEQNKELNKLREQVKKLQEQNRKRDNSNKNEKTAEQILADIVSEYI